jgi:hypothetical protein
LGGFLLLFLKIAEVAQISMAAFYRVQVSTQKWQGQILGHFVHKFVWSPWIHAMCCVVLCCVAKNCSFYGRHLTPPLNGPSDGHDRSLWSWNSPILNRLPAFSTIKQFLLIFLEVE